jgi:hypothetical protein
MRETTKRKVIYAVCAGLLLIPIIGLGQPASRADRASGGLIARERFNQDLGDATLGDVDPASSAMSLVLLGMRGMAASVLWSQAEQEKMTKQWSQLEATVERILLLQPHFQTVWKMQCWNLTYNVSAECDAVEDRYFWVKKGLIFLQRGVTRNKHIPELPHDTGDFCGKKIGRADERDFYRKYFVVDPDTEQFQGGPDPKINSSGEDNYLRARTWYQLANEVADEGVVQQHKMDGPLFYAYPYRSLMDYSTAKQQDAVSAPVSELEDLFKDAQQKWAEAYDQWTSIYGRRAFNTAVFGWLQIDGSDEELQKYAVQDNMTLAQKIEFRDRYQNTTGYRFWKERCLVESEDDMAAAHRLIIEGRKKHREDQDMEAASQLLGEGLTRLQKVFDRHRTPAGVNDLLHNDHDLAEEAVKALLIYRQARDLWGQPIGEGDDFPCKEVWTDPDMQGIVAAQTQRFQRWQGSAPAGK